jgi:hypothetical protein
MKKLTLANNAGPVLTLYREGAQSFFGVCVDGFSAIMADSGNIRSVGQSITMPSADRAQSVCLTRTQIGRHRVLGRLPWVPKQAFSGILGSSHFWITLE